MAVFFQKERFATKKELLRMTQLTADCTKVFPPDFASFVPEEIVKAVRKFALNIFFLILFHNFVIGF